MGKTEVRQIKRKTLLRLFSFSTLRIVTHRRLYWQDTQVAYIIKGEFQTWVVPAV